ncbi:sialyltransferase [Chloropicon primus]|uniref:Sialyltransferase n=1 Tax=Chloropicon primus TaxID=1764295 RepID=A0A5B8MY26_9CHLO|nr:hypothetical protein A3770_13p69800 [Chloropicon primus]UPR03671.1 sialyltransferase [Chloropicon primus]|eukprot:QDZ24462.1 hypothetical protein A3770_13p69800 [Chloropicon primus]
MATRRAGKIDTAAGFVEKDIESLKDVNDKSKPSTRRLRYTHVLLLVALLVMSLDAYLQFHERSEGKILPVSAQPAPDNAGMGPEPVAAPQVPEESPSAQGSSHSAAGKGYPRGRGDRTGSRKQGASRRGGTGIDRAGQVQVNGTAPADQAGSQEDINKVAEALLAELRFTPTFCSHQEQNISSKIFMTRSSVDHANNVNFDKPGDQGHGHVVLDPNFAKLLPRANFLLKQGKGVCHKTCAIVGNSGTMAHKTQGEEIDSHEAVLRINYAPTRRFEKNVGSKTTYDFSNRENAKRMLRPRMRFRQPKTKIIFFEGSSPVNRRTIFGPLLKRHPEQEIDFLHPQFVNNAQSLWFKIKKEMEVRKGVQYHNKPMSGIYAVLFMLQICESVDMYGFEAYTKPSRNSPYHYFDAVKGVTSVHSFDFAIDVFKAIGNVLQLSLK